MQEHSPEAQASYLAGSAGLRSWLTSTDHKRIAISYLAGIFGILLLGVTFAQVLRLGAQAGDSAVLGGGILGKLFSLHGIVMVFFFGLPAIPATLGNFVLPLMLGAKDMALPRLNRLALHLYLYSGLCVVVSIVAGAVNTGWTLLPAPEGGQAAARFFLGLGLHLLSLNLILTGLNFVLTVMRSRPIHWHLADLPVMVWSLLAVGVLSILSGPFLGGIGLLVAGSQLGNAGWFSAAGGADLLGYRQLFWFFSHPALFVAVLPAIGVVTEILATFSRKPVSGRLQIPISIWALTGLSFAGWGTHLFAGGQSPLSSTVFSALSLLVAIPATYIAYHWLATLHRGAIEITTPFLFALAALMQLAVGALSGLFLGALSTGIHLESSTFVVGHLHYLLAGGTLTAFLAGLYYWWPKMFGRRTNERWGNLGAGLIFLGINLAFFPYFMAGAAGVLARSGAVDSALAPALALATVGIGVFSLGLLVVVLNLLHSAVSGEPAPANPWGGATAEWAIASPPPLAADVAAPAIPYDFGAQEFDPQTGNYQAASVEG